MSTRHQDITNDVLDTTKAYLHVKGFVGTHAQRVAYPMAGLLKSITWYESDTLTDWQWNGASWDPVGSGASGFLDKGFVTLVNGIATINSAHCHAPGTVGYLLTPQDVNTLGTPRIDAASLVDGVSIQVNSTGATDDGVIAWAIFQP